MLINREHHLNGREIPCSRMAKILTGNIKPLQGG